jgi:hypothetical protein
VAKRLYEVDDPACASEQGLGKAWQLLSEDLLVAGGLTTSQTGDPEADHDRAALKRKIAQRSPVGAVLWARSAAARRTSALSTGPDTETSHPSALRSTLSTRTPGPKALGNTVTGSCRRWKRACGLGHESESFRSRVACRWIVVENADLGCPRPSFDT